MNKVLSTLPSDIYDLLSRETSKPPIEGATLGTAIQDHAERAMQSSGSSRELKKMWATDIGKQCHRATWYGFHNWKDKAPLPGHTNFKFLYGNVLEEIVLYLAEHADHTVTNHQQRVEFEAAHGWKVSGKIDGVVDGRLVDVKSASSYGFADYAANGVNTTNDKFGYRYQLAFYYYYGPEEWRKQPPAFIFLDKSLGHIAIAEMDLPTKEDLDNHINEKIFYLESPNLPNRTFQEVPEGAKGNMKLCTQCSYCDFKKSCWPQMRTFLYSKGPVFLTKVVSLPNVTEVAE